VPSLFWAKPDLVPEMMSRIGDGATAAGRAPSEIRRIFNVGGKIVDGATRDLLKGPPEHWIEALDGFALELGLDTFVFWPDEEPLVQLQRFAEEVVPSVRRWARLKRDRLCGRPCPPESTRSPKSGSWRTRRGIEAR
jgi:hypothetical protein